MTHAGTVFKRHVDALPHQLDDGMATASQLIEPETGTVALAFQHAAPGPGRAAVGHSRRRAGRPRDRHAPPRPGQARGNRAEIVTPLVGSGAGASVTVTGEPAHRVRIYIHDSYSWLSYFPVIGRMIRDRAHWPVTEHSDR
jgi:hypothetical protein